ncbi:MAG TPA: type I methionyl aminopeptidase [candidate division Zixibacteria bacterium]|nr:type I methionyl aminopeptidase [candidate division Zixibacteria bacterium]
MIVLKSSAELEAMRRSGMVVAETIHALCKNAKVGIATSELNEIAGETIRSFGAESAFLGYRASGTKRGFPGIVCISINEEIVHGIPGERRLEDGDLVSFDVGVRLDGFCGDAAASMIVGEAPEGTKRLLDVTLLALHNGIEQAVAGSRIKDIGRAVQLTAESAGFGVVRDLVGHGIGRNLHEDPQVPNFVSKGYSPKIMPGMTIAIEPMITMGDWHVEELDDEWTIVTRDSSISAHFEHTVAVTEDGPRILTLRENEREGFDLD